MNLFFKIIFILISSKFIKVNEDIVFNDLSFKRLDFTNYKRIKSFIFKKDFYKLNNNNVDSFEFLNYSKNLGGKIGINLSRNNIFNWYLHNQSKIFYPWIDDYTSNRLINIIYNYHFITSSSNENEIKNLKKIILVHIYRVIHDFNYRDINEITSYDIIANTLSNLILGNNLNAQINYIEMIIDKQVDRLGMHKTYNILEHAKFLNNLYELRNIFLYKKIAVTNKFEQIILKMTSILNEYFHLILLLWKPQGLLNILSLLHQLQL